MALDPVGTAGHLVSMVVADGIVNAPTALLANHLETSLAAAVAKEGSGLECTTVLVSTLRYAYQDKTGSYLKHICLLAVCSSCV